MRRLAVMGLMAVSLAAWGQGNQHFAEDRIKAPEFREVTEWVNSKPLSLEKLKGRVVVLHFMTYG